MPDIEKHWKIGQEIVGAVKTVTNTPDAVSLHSDPLAKKAGFKAGLILNEYHFTQITHMLLDYFGYEWLMHGEIEINYITPLFDGDTFVPKAKILGEDPPGSGRLSLEIWCENQNQVQLAFGKASCLVESENSHHE